MRETLVKTEEFKDSPVGRIPKDWEVSSLASLTQYITYGFTNPMPTTKDGPWMITAFDIADGKICYGQARHTSEKAYKNDLTQKSKPNLGDILITKDGTLGRIAVVDRTSICINQSVACLRPLLDTDVRFLVHYLRSDIGQERMLADAGGSTIKHIYITKLAQMEVPVPPREERTRISDILDTIDEAIARTSSLIAKLKQMKAGLLHDLLTRGLDENGELRDAIAHPKQFKDSPLGRIPKNWEVCQLRDFYTVPARNGLYKPAKFYGRGVLMIHMPQMFRGFTIDVSDAARVDVNPSELERFSLAVEDLVFARRSLNLEGAGRCSLVPALSEPTTFESSIIRVRLLTDKLRPIFANYFLNSETGFRLRLPLIRQVAVSGVSSEDIASIPVPCPPPEEQDAIIKIIDTHDTRIRTEEAYHDKLKLQKQGLMHDLLTGKVRVKNA
ncbi:restriction endonuclease subunit S [Coleofasciculus sp. FACHB-T130]|uniref:restriction endonuclease subunit S n=1 Tax=Cyanophyceae TaxID=3028117 RepID=UPI001686BA9B|nr:restriction endonuclease subunit S [Coleofasciculus sp. FACHB-T130]MBD1881272.1 restriction endonuclease subunit S [Coleofasciculus sp. FACHB-T130]